MQIPFIGGAYTGRSTNINVQTCINLFPVVDPQDAKSVLALYGTPGLTLFCQPVSSTGLPVRAVYAVGEFLYAVIANTVYKITTAGSASSLGTISTSTGNVWMADNGLQILIVDGTENGYIVTLTTGVMAVITSADFPTASSVTFQDGYFVVIEKDTGRFYISDLYDGTVWNSLDFATAEGQPDNALAVLSNAHNLWIFGAKSVEVYYNSGDADFPFERITGALLDIGCGAEATPTHINGVLYWLSDKGQVHQTQGYQAQVISTPTIDYQISTYSTISDAIGFTYAVEGHSFYVLTFPSAKKTWVYDTGTTFWHEWQSYYAIAPFWSRHRSNCGVQFGLNWIVGDYDNGALYTVDMDVYTDNSNAIRRERTGQVISKDRLRISHNRVEIEFESGVGLTGSGQGIDPQVVLLWSDDGGHMWSNQHWSSIGKIGEYKNRAVWRRLGSPRGRNYRMVISDPVKVVVINAFMELEAGAE